MKFSRFITFLITLTCLATPALSSGHIPNLQDGKSTASISPMLEKVMPAVVNISVLGELPAAKNTRSQRSPKGSAPKFQNVGSGVIIDADNGYIVTNAHVIKNAKLITITLSDGRVLKAKSIGADKAVDIAVLQVKAKGLSALPFHTTDKLKVGDFVVAIGNPFGLSQTVTSGVISALNRSGLGIEGYENFIQTDAPINPGNSGGALINLKGELIGINTAIIAPSNGNVGIGFAVPNDMAQSIATQLIRYGQVKRGVIGVMVQSLTPNLENTMKLGIKEGALVTQIVEGSPAENAGLKAKDVILKINNKTISSGPEVRNTVGLLPIGSSISLDIQRNHKVKRLNITVADPNELNKKQPHIPFFAGATLKDFDELSVMGKHIRGIAVIGLDFTSNAWLAGLRPGDVIVNIDDNTVNTISEINKLINKNHDHILVKVQRGLGQLFIAINKE